MGYKYLSPQLVFSPDFFQPSTEYGYINIWPYLFQGSLATHPPFLQAWKRVNSQLPMILDSSKMQASIELESHQALFKSLRNDQFCVSSLVGTPSLDPLPCIYIYTHIYICVCVSIKVIGMLLFLLGVSKDEVECKSRVNFIARNPNPSTTAWLIPLVSHPNILIR